MSVNSGTLLPQPGHLRDKAQKPGTVPAIPGRLATMRTRNFAAARCKNGRVWLSLAEPRFLALIEAGSARLGVAPRAAVLPIHFCNIQVRLLERYFYNPH